MVDLNGKVALVTGATGGLGAATAKKLASLGAKIAINYSGGKSREAAMGVLKEVMDAEGSGMCVMADVSNSGQVKEMFDEVEAGLGGVFVLVNNAGIYVNKPGRLLHEVPEDEMSRVIDINLKGTFICAAEAARRMVGAKTGGRIVNISSVAGVKGSVAGAHYSASKAGVIGLTYTMADQLGQFGILTNSVAPGPVRTKLLEKLTEEDFERQKEKSPIGRIATADEIADAIAFFAQTDIVNGQVLVVDGGNVKH